MIKNYDSYQEISKYSYAVDDTVYGIWKVTYKNNGFDFPLFVRGSENEVREYMESEFGYMGRYTMLTDEEVDCVYALRLTIYIA